LARRGPIEENLKARSTLLGVKKIKFDIDDDEATVANKIMYDFKDNDGVDLGFPQLRGIGGV
jgi:hypothetical protein